RWAARQELARSVEDVLARRSRALILDARSSIEAAPRVAAILALELGHNDAWIQAQITAYTQLASGYLLD
ncbi:MAG: glycerol-3-phosphate dehydrogenase C-terminal domain-containing protein, partial [Verrucomicrobiota bacterium]